MNCTVIKATVTAALLAGVVSTAGAATLATAPIQPGDGEKLVCTVVNTSGKSLNVTAALIDRWGAIVTDFVRTDWNESGTALVTVHAESASPDARYCRVTVKGGGKGTVTASLQACTLDETICSSPVAAR